MRRVRSLLIKEVAQLKRNRRLAGILIIAPVMQLLVLGFAATTDVREIAMAVRDRDGSSWSREYARTLSSSGYFLTTAWRGDAEPEERVLIDGRAGLVVAIPEDFGRRIERGEDASVQVLVDGADSSFAVTGLNYFQKANALFNARLARALGGEARRTGWAAAPTIAMESRCWYNANLLSRNHMVPAVMGVLLLVTTMIVTSMALVKEREDGTMEQIIVTPLRAGELIVGKLLPFVGVGLAEMTLAIPVAVFLFGVPLRGSLIAIYGLSGVFLLTTLGLGLLVSTLVRTQQQAMLVSAFFVMMPFVLLSGFIFPVENMPGPIRLAAHLIPLKYYLTGVRGIFLKDLGWLDIGHETAVLFAWGLAVLSLAALRFHKRLD